MESEKMFEITVIGAGLVGSAAAKYCSSLSANVLLIGPEEPKEDDKDREIFGCHYDEGRITRIYDPLSESRILNQKAIEQYREIETASGIQFYRPIGCLIYGEQGTPMLDRALEQPLLLSDVTSTLPISHPFLRLRKDELAFLEPSPAGMINPRALILAQKKVAKNQGCQFEDDVVERVREVRDDFGKRLVLELTTSSGMTFRSKKVLLCTNGFTNFKDLLPEGKTALMGYSKSQVALLRVSPEEADRLRNMPSLIYGRKTENGQPQNYGIYSMPPLIYPDGKQYIKMGWDHPTGEIHTLEEMKNWYLGRGSPEIEKELVKIAKELITDLKYEEIKPMTCSTTSSPSKLPYIEMVTPYLGVAICGNGNSAKSSNELGRIAAYLISKDEWVSEIPREKFQVTWVEM